jgi:hypothetical protein
MSDLSDARDVLVKIVATVTDGWDEPLDEVHDIPQIVNAILAAGWRHVVCIGDLGDEKCICAPQWIASGGGCMCWPQLGERAE